MGFFSSILKIAAPILTTALGTAAGTVAAGRPAAVAAAVVSGASAEQRRIAAAAPAADSTGRLRRRTIVETFDPVTGAVVKVDAPLPGAPAVMQSDVAAANRLNRQLRRLNKMQPRRTVKQSQTARLKEEVVDNALRRAANGHNGHGIDDRDIVINRT